MTDPMSSLNSNEIPKGGLERRGQTNALVWAFGAEKILQWFHDKNLKSNSNFKNIHDALKQFSLASGLIFDQLELFKHG